MMSAQGGGTVWKLLQGGCVVHADKEGRGSNNQKKIQTSHVLGPRRLNLAINGS